MFKEIKTFFKGDHSQEDDKTLCNIMLQTRDQISALEFKIDAQNAEHTLRLESIEALLRRYLFLIEDLE